MIFLEALNIILNAITYVMGWFLELYNAAGALGMWSFCVFVFLLYRFILTPLFGQVAGSDTVKQSKRNYGLFVRSVRSKR